MMKKLTFKIKFPKLRDKWHEILMRPENADGLTVRELMWTWKGEERVRRALHPSSYGSRLEPKYGPKNDNAVGNLMAKDRRFNLQPSRVNGIRTNHHFGLWVAVDNPALTLNSNHTPADTGEEDGEE
jgi:hypothetical protein